MRLAFAIVCGTFLVAMPLSPIPANAAKACSYQKCFNHCVKTGANNASMCSRYCSRG
jgi:hypothetical protein